MAKAAYQAPGMTLAEAEARVAAMLAWSVSDADQLARIDESITLAGQAACLWQGRRWWWLQAKAHFNTIAAATISTIARVSNVVTVTTSAVHGILADMEVKISGVTATGYDGMFLVASVPTTKTFTYTDNGDDANSTDGTVYAAAYPLRTVNTNALQDIWAPTKVMIDDDYDLGKLDGGRENYDQWVTMYDTGTGQPNQYVLWGNLTMGLLPIPDGAYKITIPYLRRHSKVTSAGSSEAALIVPAEFHSPVYVAGAAWIIRHDTRDVASLEGCPEFASGMDRMAAADPGLHYDPGQALLDDPRIRYFKNTGNLSI